MFAHKTEVYIAVILFADPDTGENKANMWEHMAGWWVCKYSIYALYKEC